MTDFIPIVITAEPRLLCCDVANPYLQLLVPEQTAVRTELLAAEKEGALGFSAELLVGVGRKHCVNERLPECMGSFWG